MENFKRFSIDAINQMPNPPAFIPRCDSTSSGCSSSQAQNQQENLKKAAQPQSRQQKSPRSPQPPLTPASITEFSSAESAMQFLERRQSNESTLNQRRHSYYSQIQPDLYRRRGSIISIASSHGSIHSGNSILSGNTSYNGNCANKKTTTHRSVVVGRAQLQLNYDFSKSDFIVQLVKASIQLPLLQLQQCQFSISLSSENDNENSRDLKRRCSKIEMYKDGQIKELSKQFKFSMSYDELMTQSLSMELFSTQRRKNLGSSVVVQHAKTTVALTLLNPSDDELLIWLDLESVNEEKNSCGELMLCLQYLPSAAHLTLTVHEASNLPARVDGYPNTYVRASLIQDEKIILKKRKTNVRKSTISPIWNEALIFGVDQNLISRCRLEVCVMDCDRFGNNSRPIARVNFSSFKNLSANTSNSSIKYGLGGISATRLWREAVQGQNTVLPQWVPLESITTKSSPVINSTS